MRGLIGLMDALPTPRDDSERKADADAIAAGSPLTPASELARIAEVRADLHPTLAVNPATYPELLAWLALSPDPAVRAALDARRAASQRQSTVHDTASASTSSAMPPEHGVSTSPAPSEPPPPPTPGPSSGDRAPSGSASDTVGLPAVAPTTGPPPTDVHRSRRRLAIVTASIATTVALVAAGSVVALTAMDASSTAYSTSPTITTLVDITTLGSDFHVLALDGRDRATLTSGTMTVVRMGGDRGQALVGIDSTSHTGYPAWMVPFTPPDSDSSSSAACTLSGSTFTCADGITRDVTTGRSSTSTTAVSASASATPAPSGSSADVAPGGSPTADARATQSGGSVPSTTTPQSHRLDSEPTADVPWSVDGTSLKDSAGAVIDGLDLTADTPVWAASTTVSRTLGSVPLPGDTTAWVVSDSVAMWGLQGSTVSWHLDLGADGGSLNGLGTDSSPRWIVADGAVVLALSGGMVGLDARTGRQLWRIATPLDSWFSTGQQIVMETRGTLAFADFSAPSSSGVQSGQSGQLVAPTTTKAPTLDDLKNSTLEVSKGCLDTARRGSEVTTGASATFKDGVATFAGGDGQITIVDSASTIMDGQPVTAVVLTCGPPDAYDVVELYGTDRSLLAFSDASATADDRIVQGFTPHARYLDLAAIGDTLTFDVPHVGVYGDQKCNGCPAGASATATLTWDGTDLVPAGVVYHVAGNNVRVPSDADVQKLYDAVSKGDDAYAARHMSPSAIAELRVTYGLSTTTVRSVQFAPGGVVTCALAGPVDYDPAGGLLDGMIGVRDHEALVGTWLGISPGDTVCGVLRGSSGETLLDPDGSSYRVFMVLRGTPDGSVYVKSLGRTFG